jgi:protein O-mannosyl-transferase
VSAIAYASIALASMFAVARFRDWRSMLGWCGLTVATLFVTEFATVWIQDPFVLYRSYLWAIAAPGVVYLGSRSLKPTLQVVALLVVCLVFSVLSYERIDSMKTPLAVWDDAVDKLPEGITVGQSRAFFNRGEARRSAGDARGAARDFQYSTRLGDGGEGLLNIATMLSESGRSDEAMQALVGAMRRGMDASISYFNAGAILVNVGALNEAFDAYSEALKRGLSSDVEPEARARRAMIAIDLRRLDIARDDIRVAVERQPMNLVVQQAQGFEALARGEFSVATAAFDRSIAQQPQALSLYGRARARLASGDRAGAIADLDEAIKREPANRIWVEAKKKLINTESQEKTRSAETSAVTPITKSNP